MIVASQIIQAVSELYCNKGAAVGAAFRLLRRSLLLEELLGVPGEAPKRLISACGSKRRKIEREPRKFSQWCTEKEASAKSLACLQNNVEQQTQGEVWVTPPAVR